MWVLNLTVVYVFHVKHPGKLICKRTTMKYQNEKVGAVFLPELRESLPVDFRLDDYQMQQFGIYLDLILQWNQKAGLISPADEERLIKRHIVESLGVLSTNLLQPSSQILDVGTGGGFPGIPLKIAMPSLHMTLLDSRRMKMLFLQEVLRVLSLENLHIVHERAEKVSAKLAQKFDFVVARAVTDLETLWTWSLPLLKKGGSLIAQKGGDLNAEINQLLSSYSSLRPKKLHYPETWPIDPSRCIISLRKE